MLPISLIGAPTDVGASRVGCRLGPGALRVAGIEEALRAFGMDVRDCGDVRGPANPELPPVGGYRHLEEVAAWARSVSDSVYAELREDRLPLLLGGDHSLAVGSISAVARRTKETGRKLRVLWFDAHADFNTAELTPSGNIHGMPVACVTGHGPENLVNLAGFVPAVATKDVRQIGLRSVDPGEKRFLRQEAVTVYDMRYVDEIGMRQTMEEVLAGVDSDTHLHVSLDLDFIDPDVAPGVGTPVRGGPTYRETQLCMEMIADSGALASLDIVELNPALDLRNETAQLAVDLVESLFGKSTLLRMREG